jgi:hypothetical protein
MTLAAVPWRPRSDAAWTAAGSLLLPGLLHCGHCGRMHAASSVSITAMARACHRAMHLDEKRIKETSELG